MASVNWNNAIGKRSSSKTWLNNKFQERSRMISLTLLKLLSPKIRTR